MTRGWIYLALAGVLALGACGEQQQKTPTGPDFKVSPPPTACDFGAVKNLINSYFSPPTQQTAQGYESLMESGGAQSSGAIENGFKIMDLIGAFSRTTSPPSFTVGSSLTKALTKCMFDASSLSYTSLANGAGLDGVAFDKSLDFANGGVYFVVGAGVDVPNVLKGTIGGTYDPSTGHVSGGTRLSAAGPGDASSTTFALGTSWTDVLAGNAFEGGRALVYAYPVTQSPVVYEWATIDPLTVFSPYALVSICDVTDATNIMVNESNAGVLAFSTANLCTVPDATGVTATGFKSHFQNALVASVHLAWVTPPPAKMKVNTAYTAIARATTLVDNVVTGVNGTCLILSGTNNNGQPLTLVGTKECDSPTSTQLAALTKTDPATNAAGYATFSVKVTKSGGITFTLSGFEVVGRTGTFGNTVQTKTNVTP